MHRHRRIEKWGVVQHQGFSGGGVGGLSQVCEETTDASSAGPLVLDEYQCSQARGEYERQHTTSQCHRSAQAQAAQ